VLTLRISDLRAQAIVDTVRVMRHEGMRVLISTQSPTTMPPELLELTSMTILHRFQSAEWAKYLSSKVTLPEGSFEKIKALEQGQALVLSTQLSSHLTEDCADCITVNVRPRLTRDLGASRLNAGSSAQESPMK
jgi:DNA phosphorothioation-dependent restriction protein DptH